MIFPSLSFFSLSVRQSVSPPLVMICVCCYFICIIVYLCPNRCRCDVWHQVNLRSLLRMSRCNSSCHRQRVWRNVNCFDNPYPYTDTSESCCLPCCMCCGSRCLMHFWSVHIGYTFFVVMFDWLFVMCMMCGCHFCCSYCCWHLFGCNVIQQRYILFFFPCCTGPTWLLKNCLYTVMLHALYNEGASKASHQRESRNSSAH